MEEKEKKKVTEAQHQLTLINRGLLSIEGVHNLGSYDQEVVYVETDYGTLEIKGSSLHIQQLNLDQGKIIIDGDVQSFVYLEEGMNKKGKGFFGRLMR